MTFRPGKSARWKLVWSDEFDGDAVDPDKWDFEIGNGFFDYRSHAWVAGWGNGELQYYTRSPDNIFVRDGLLHIRALKESLHGCGYTSARIKTRRRDGAPLFVKQYGRFEIRAKVPHGKGLWPALWMLPLDEAYGPWAASGEIDILEIVGERPREYLGTIHFGSTYPKRELVTHVHKLADGSTVGEFHVYAVEWEPGEIRWSVDGVVWAKQTFWWSCSKQRNGKGLVPRRETELNPWPAPFDRPFYLVMNVAVGGNFPGVPNATTQFPADLVIDYVRVYDKVGGYGKPRQRGPGRMPYQKKRGGKHAT
jgi:beta-glucanase (GH16 family)